MTAGYSCCVASLRYAAAASDGLGEERAKSLRLEQAPPPASRREPQLGEDCLGDRRQAGLAGTPHSPASERAQRHVPLGRASNMRRTTSCGATVPFHRCSSRKTTSKRPDAATGRAGRRARTRSRSRRPGRDGAHAEPQVLAVADRRELGQLATGDEQGDAGIPETERRELQRAPRRARARSARPGDDGVDGRSEDASSASESIASACAAKASANSLDARRAGSRARRPRGGRPSARDARSRPRALRGGRTRPTARPEPFHGRRRRRSGRPGRRDRLTSREATRPITPSCQSAPASA